MSLLSKVFKGVTQAVAPFAPIIGGALGGPVGAALGGVVSQLGTRTAAAPVIPGAGSIAPMPTPVMGTLPRLGGAVVGAGVAGVRLGIAGARVAISSAKYYCSRYPGWCIAAGGLGAVQSMVESGQLPPHRRRRRRGISAREFGAFRRVHNVLSGFCAPRMRVRKG